MRKLLSMTHKYLMVQCLLDFPLVCPTHHLSPLNYLPSIPTIYPTVSMVHSEGDQPWDFFGRNDAKAKTPVLWPPHAKSWLTRKDWCWKGLGQEEKGTTENEKAGWHYRLNNVFEWTPGVGDGQGGMLVCCDSWGCKELNTTEQLNWTELISIMYLEFPTCSIAPLGYCSLA